MERSMPAIRVSCAGKLFLFLLAAGAATGQIYPPGGYPPGGYPPTGYPGGGYPGGGIPIPVPSRGSKPQPNTSTKGQPLPNFRGKLKKMDAKTISLALDDDRVLDFRRDSKTKFYKGGDEVKDPKFNPGDQLSIEGPEDNTGAMMAVNVYWEKAAGGTGATADAKSKDDKVPDAWADAPSQTHGTEAAPPAAKHDSDDPGPPTLQRGAAADPSREKSAPVPQTVAPDAQAAGASGDRPTITAANGQVPERLPQYIPRDDGNNSGNNSGNDAIEGSLRHQDDLIRKAADTALDFTETLPNYVCQEFMSRYQSETKPANWQAIDVVGTEVIYENGKEDYRKITLNGRPINKKIEEMGGSWSTGEFGTVLIGLFSPGTAAEFHYRKDSRIAGILTKEYDLSVTHAHSNWSIHTGNQTYDPAYTGTVWIDPASARVMRIEMSARSFPSDFLSDYVESATDYEYVRLGDAKQYLLPVHSESLSCQRGTNDCSRNVIDFRNYRKYTGESTITFGDPKK
jgi:hypothetical protein